MAKKKRRDGLVYSTNPDLKPSFEENEDMEAIDPQFQNLRVMIDRKQRKGKDVTLVTGYEGPESDLKELGKFLKSKCGVGGSVKDGEILIQGNQRDKVVQLLIEKGYTRTKKSGG